MKRFAKIAIALTLAVALTGCGLFASGSTDKGESKTDSIDLPIGVAYEPPADLDYDTYYLAQFDVRPEDPENLLSEYAEFGLKVEYHVTYAKDGKAVAQDDIFVLETAEGAKEMYDAFIEMGAGPSFHVYEKDDTVLVYAYDKETVEGTILQFAGYDIGLDADCDAKTYAQFDADIYSGVLLGGNQAE